jgi:hypothetical protein
MSITRFNVTFSERLFLLTVQCFILLIFSCSLFEYFKTEQILSGEEAFLKSTAFNVSLLAFLIGSYVHLGKALSIFRTLFTNYEEGKHFSIIFAHIKVKNDRFFGHFRPFLTIFVNLSKLTIF